MRRIGLLIDDAVTLLDVSGPAEVFSRAPGYELALFSPAGGEVTSATGLSLGRTDAASAAAADTLDTLIVTGADDLPDRPFDPAHLAATALLTRSARRVASVSGGAFLLAELGLLDGRRATTHWRNARDLARRYPRVHVEPDTLHVHDGRFITSAGITAGIDLALSLVEEDLDADTARQIARDMVVVMHRPGGQSQFASRPHLPHVEHPILRGVLARIEQDPTGRHTVAGLAAAASVSTRHLARLFREELGTTPARWLERLRLATAQRLILDGHSITAAARGSGFSSDESLRRSFERRLHTTPTEYKARFSSTFRRAET